MKKLLLLILMYLPMLASAHVSGNEHPVINKTPQMAYRPFIEEGKVWVVSTSYSDAIPSEIDPPKIAYCYFDGDTIIGGQICKQMKTISNYNPSPLYFGAWYEQDKKVYFAGNRPQFELIYDFTLSSNDSFSSWGYPVVVKKTSGAISGFKGTYYDFWRDNKLIGRWLEGIGCNSYPFVSDPWDCDGWGDPTLQACFVNDEVIYLNDAYEDGATPASARKRFDFTHTIKTRPKAPKKRVVSTSEPPSLYGEYNDSLLGIHLEPLDDAYMVRITNEAGKTVYEKAVNAGSIVALNIDISNYPEGCFTVTVENSQETFIGAFEVQTTDIATILRTKMNSGNTYDLQGRRVTRPKKGVYIRNGRKVVNK